MQQLLETLLAWAKEQGMREIYLDTIDKFLAVHRFYEKNGFVELQKNQLPLRFQ